MAGHNSHVAIGEGGAQGPLALGRPTCGAGRPQGGPLVPLFGQIPLQRSYSFETLMHVQKFARKDVQMISQRILKLGKYFWYFYKKKKVLENFQHAEIFFMLLFLNHVVEKIQKGGKTKWRKKLNMR